MNDLFSTRHGIALYLIGWLCLGAMIGALIVILSGDPWPNAMLFAIPLTMVYALGSGNSSYYLCHAYPLADKGLLQIAGVFSIASVISAFCWTSLAYIWNTLCFLGEWEWAAIHLNRPIVALIFGLGIVLYVLAGIVRYLIIEFERSQQAQRRELELKLFAQDAELRLLRTQIDPHFLFNSLNSISALTSQNPAGARQMTLQLADFFRHSLGLGAHQRIALKEEIGLSLNFLAIEKIRFGSRLRVEEAVDDMAKTCLVPPLLIQPLVENAVKHGISHLTEGGTVRITAQRAGSQLRICVENDIDPDGLVSNRNGIGLDNVRQRLAGAYAHEASIAWIRENNIFRVNVLLPAESAD